jgi:tetrahydromethanopterin S-methyltransferase subunit A
LARVSASGDGLVLVLPHEPEVYNLGSGLDRMKMNFKLKARVNRSDAQTIRKAVEQLSAKGSVRKAGDEFVVEAETEGDSARGLNRTLLSALRKVEKRTTLRAEWT